jgi:DNA-binding transcriptional regulator YiaG
MTIRNNHVFKGHKTLLGSRYVTYAEVELPVKYELFSKSKDGFDWGHNSSASIQLAFSMLHQLSDVEFASEYALNFSKEVIKSLNSRDWILNASEVVNWIERNSDESRIIAQNKNMSMVKPPQKNKKIKRNVVKDVCRKLSITQKNLAEILEVPEGTVSSWAVKNEIPRLGKKAIEFYIQNQKNQEVVDSYKNFVKLLQSA